MLPHGWGIWRRGVKFECPLLLRSAARVVIETVRSPSLNHLDADGRDDDVKRRNDPEPVLLCS
jgi:hypothetical protein